MNKTVTATLIAAMGASACAPFTIKDENGVVVQKPFSSENFESLIPILAIGIALIAGANSGDGCASSSFC
jgi:hypothetical protein